MFQVKLGASGCGKKAENPMVFLPGCICVSHIFYCEILGISKFLGSEYRHRNLWVAVNEVDRFHDI